MSNSGDISFSTLLKQFRQRAGLKQLALAYAIGKHSRGSIQAWEQGRYLPDSREIVFALAKALRLSEREANQLLRAAHYPPEYLSSEAEETKPVAEPLNATVKHHDVSIT